MDLLVTRDSVAMGDDVHAPHEHTLTLVRPATVGRVARWLARGTYLASVVGGSTWVLRADGRAVAVVALADSRWRRGTVVPVAGPDEPVGGAELHVDYALDADPVALADELRGDPSRRTPRRYRVRFVELGRSAVPPEQAGSAGTFPHPYLVQVSVVGPHLAVSVGSGHLGSGRVLPLAEAVGPSGELAPAWAEEVERAGATWAVPLLAALVRGEPVSEADVVAGYRSRFGAEPSVELLPVP